MTTKMERRLSRRDEKFALDLVAMMNDAGKPSWRIQAPTKCITQVFKGRRAMRGGALASAS